MLSIGAAGVTQTRLADKIGDIFIYSFSRHHSNMSSRRAAPSLNRGQRSQRSQIGIR